MKEPQGAVNRPSNKRSMAGDPRYLMRGKVVRPHPAVEAIHEANQKWAFDFALVNNDIAAKRHARIGSASCSAHTYSYADEFVIQLGADLISWLFLFDDLYGEGTPDDTSDSMTERFALYANLLRTGEFPGEEGPFSRALLDIRERAMTRASHEWLERFAQCMEVYFNGCLRELLYRRLGKAPALGEYRDLRAESIGCYPVYCLIELENGLLTQEEANSAELLEVRTTAALLCAWVNDVYSYPKERADNDPLNLVAVLSQEYALNEDEAYVTAAEVFNIDLEMFEAKVEDLQVEALSEAMAGYLDGLTQWIHGNFTWTGSCGRY